VRKKKKFVGKKDNNRQLFVVCYERNITYQIYCKGKVCAKK